MRSVDTILKDEEYKDFVPRERMKPVRTLAWVYLLSMVSIFVVVFKREVLGGDFFALFLIMVILISLAGYTILVKVRNLDLVMATEFQNLLFASAAALGSRFCMFVKSDGTIVYANQGTRDMLPRVAYDESQALDRLFDAGGVAKKDVDKIYQAMIRGSRERVVFPIREKEGQFVDFIVTVEPLKRPAGYFVLRGRNYQVSREGSVKMPDILSHTTIEKIQQLINHSPVGMVVTDEFGKIELVNHALEKTLGYDTGEIVNKGTYLKHLLQQENQALEEDIREFNGEVLLLTRNGMMMKALMEQHIARENDGRVCGSTVCLRAL